MRALILLVEEDRLTRASICDMLKSLDYRVLGVSTFARALRLMLTNGIGFDALILSVKGGWDGDPAYAAVAKAAQPEIKVIIASSLADRGQNASLVDAYVPKPFILESVGEALIKVLRHTCRQG